MHLRKRLFKIDHHVFNSCHGILVSNDVIFVSSRYSLQDVLHYSTVIKLTMRNTILHHTDNNIKVEVHVPLWRERTHIPSWRWRWWTTPLVCPPGPHCTRSGGSWHRQTYNQPQISVHGTEYNVSILCSYIWRHFVRILYCVVNNGGQDTCNNQMTVNLFCLYCVGLFRYLR